MFSDSEEEKEGEGEKKLHPVERWSKLVNTIRETTRTAFPSSPSYDPDQASVFQRFWRGVMADLKTSVAADDEIPKYVTDPPVKRFAIALWDKPDPMCCPCMLADAGSQVLVQREEGVRKSDVLEAFTDYMYGRDDGVGPQIFTEAEQEESNSADGAADDDEDDDDDDEEEEAEKRPMPGALLYRVDWMQMPGGRGGERFVYYTPDATVFMYCCPGSEYLEKSEKEKAG